MRRWASCLVVWACGCHAAAPTASEGPSAVDVHCVPAERQSVDVTETMRGRVAAPPGGDLPVASQVSGRITDVLVHEGDHVASGAVIASIDGSASRDVLRQADAAIAQAKAAEANALATLDRVRQLVAKGIAAKQELDDASAREDQASAAVAAATAASDLARHTLGRVQVRTSFAGIVTRVWRGSGALVDGTEATPIVQLADMELAEFDAVATQEQLQGIAPEQTATVLLATHGEPWHGTVRARSTALDSATGLGLVRIAVDIPPPVTLGVFGTATIWLGKRNGVLVVPAAAMRGAVADGAEVAVCDGTKAQIRRVHTGWRDDQRVEVRDGLSDGERVAIDHVLGLEADSPIAEVK